MGFSLVFCSADGVLWNGQRGNFPYSKGLLPVVLSWFFSPIISGILSSITFNLNRVAILRREKSTIEKAIWSLPILIFITLFINVMFELAKGAKSYMVKTWPCNAKAGPGMFDLYYEDCSNLNNAAAWIAAIVALFFGVAVGGLGMYLLTKRYRNAVNAEETAAASLEQARAQGKEAAYGNDRELTKQERQALVAYNKSLEHPSLAKDGLPSAGVVLRHVHPRCFWVQCKRGLTFDIFAELQKSDQATKDMHSNAEKFNPHTEKVYQALQVRGHVKPRRKDMVLHTEKVYQALQVRGHVKPRRKDMVLQSAANAWGTPELCCWRHHPPVSISLI